MKHAYASELDLFPVRLCFEVLIRNHKDDSGIKMVEEIQKEFPEPTPLSNLVNMIVDAIKVKDFILFKTFFRGVRQLPASCTVKPFSATFLHYLI